MANKTAPQSKTINLKINQNSYSGIKFPNTGQLFDIQQRKSIITNGQYGSFAEQGSSGIYAKYLADMVATFEVLIPKLAIDMKVPLMELDAIDSKVLLTIYLKEFKPWYDSWTEFLNSTDDEETESLEQKNTDDAA